MYIGNVYLPTSENMEIGFIFKKKNKIAKDNDAIEI